MMEKSQQIPGTSRAMAAATAPDRLADLNKFLINSLLHKNLRHPEYPQI